MYQEAEARQSGGGNVLKRNVTKSLEGISSIRMGKIEIENPCRDKDSYVARRK